MRKVSCVFGAAGVATGVATGIAAGSGVLVVDMVVNGAVFFVMGTMRGNTKKMITAITMIEMMMLIRSRGKATRSGAVEFVLGEVATDLTGEEKGG